MAAALSRADVLEKVREHLSSELEIPLDKITESTRMREDLDADSLDLYELVMELEDTYGISVSEEEAAGIETVGNAVDFVAGRLGVAGCPTSRGARHPQSRPLAPAGRAREWAGERPWRADRRTARGAAATIGHSFVLDSPSRRLVRAAGIPR